MTSVIAASTIEEAGLPVKSLDTSGTSLYSMNPLRRGDSEAFFRAAPTSSLVVAFSVRTVRSTRDTSGVGTRMAQPVNLPLSLGITSPMAWAAPVLVGIMLRAAARARRRSLCPKSSTGWSLV